MREIRLSGSEGGGAHALPTPFSMRYVVQWIAMEKLLEKAVSEASKLPESEQEALGAWLLAEIESERRWSDLFERPGTVMERMADEALDEHARGLTTPLDPDQL
jgi:hypothetical protein